MKERFPEDVLEVSAFRDQTTITVSPAKVVEIGRFLRDDPSLRYNMLTDLTVVDQRDLGVIPRFVAVYHLTSLPRGQRVRLKAPIPSDPPVLDSVTSVWPGANWPEREAYDLMGVTFRGHPDPRRILLPHDWQGYPLRKDYPLGGEPVGFTVNADDPQVARHGEQVLEAPSPLPDKPPWFGEGSETLIINVGPQHPATHGVLRVVAELDGETLVNVAPDIGHLHSGFEKTAENRTYQQFATYPDRMDYVAAMNNNLAYVMAVEKLLGCEIPKRAQYLRVILCELQRLAAHLIWLGTSTLDLSGTIMSLLQYAFLDRERILDIFEMVCGARLTTSYFCVGGCRWDVPPKFEEAVRDFLKIFPKHMAEYKAMLENNPIYRSRLMGVGKITAEQAISLGVTGPVLRSTGVAYDVRKAFPYSSYEDFDFIVPTGTTGDCWDRYLVRMEEMRQSLRIIEQALDNLPDGLVKDPNRKISLPPREELETSMEALIHHFKLVTEGFHPPVGEAWASGENPKGELGFYLVSDGGPHPYRCRIRGPSFYNLQGMEIMAKGHLLSDLVAIIGSIDITLGEVDR
ncbi:MAG: NADH dehydrogenase (quinone) subunit D [Anaerolineae bacterium]